MPQEKSTTTSIDNKSVIELAKNPTFHDRSKHIDTRYHFIRECVEGKDVELAHVKTNDQIADDQFPVIYLSLLHIREYCIFCHQSISININH